MQNEKQDKLDFLNRKRSKNNDFRELFVKNGKFND